MRDAPGADLDDLAVGQVDLVDVAIVGAELSGELSDAVDLDGEWKYASHVSAPSRLSSMMSGEMGPQITH